MNWAHLYYNTVEYSTGADGIGTSASDGVRSVPDADGGADGERAHRRGRSDRNERDVHAPARVREEDEQHVAHHHNAQIHEEHYSTHT